MNAIEPLAALGDLSLEHFMRRHWQRKPALIRNALPGFESPIGPARLFELAAQDDVESRLVESGGGRWRLRHGPFDRLPPRRRREWTLLVQGVDLHDEPMHQLLRRFRFMPEARLDDLMVSFATDGGGVGPHLDSYDVFLLQAHGRRRWQVAPPGDATLRAGVPVKLLERFEPTDEWVLEPGDMLYLPPGWGHDGVAIGDCMTFSIGFRAPSRHEFLAAFLAEAAESVGGADPRFTDRGLAPVAQAGAIPADLREQLQHWALGWKPETRMIDRFIGRFLTEPKPNVWFDTPPPIGFKRFEAAARRDGLALDRRSRIAWRGDSLWLNGERFEAPTAGRALLRRLADRRQLGTADCARALQDGATAMLLHEWVSAGWLRTGTSADG